MRLFAIGIALTALAACGAKEGMPNLRGQLAPQVVTQLPVRVMIVELPQAESAALTGIDTVNGDLVTWRSLEDQALTLESGVVVSTRGLAFDLMGSNVGLVPSKFFGQNEYRTKAVRSFSFLDGENKLSTVSYECLYEIYPAEIVPRLNGRAELSSVSETCIRPGPDIENRYYFDQTGRQVTSRQWLGDTLGYAMVEFVN